MIHPLELKRLKLELKKVEAGKADLEFRIEENLDQIERLKATINIQDDKAAELSARIASEEAATSDVK